MLLYISFSIASAGTSENMGLAITLEANRRDTGFGDSTVKMRMFLRNKQGRESVREVRIKTLETREYHRRLLLRLPVKSKQIRMVRNCFLELRSD